MPVAAILYGEPGTGKTESVYQLAKETGRGIIHVNISETKSKWFGESEKKIKEVFTKYERICKRVSVKPILLFNEADAIFGKRKVVGSNSVDQTENTIQNIILEEMEKLEGILIATTNLATNLDPAFERRFLFKIRFGKPSLEVNERIWRSKVEWLDEEGSSRLAASYGFSGGHKKWLSGISGQPPRSICDTRNRLIKKLLKNKVILNILLYLTWLFLIDIYDNYGEGN